ncbi:MAG: HNH endonuclease [Candidatus Parcubacteria bacterium]|uniref:HNH endonuclease n=1 Tax=Phormidesmis priestleyi TaxID=268141 RepID=UPI0009ECCED4|nr:HNH endonuclease signature motif containing protein [Phormidesmis priestleyi]MBC7824452.1 HNH endonuclease [Leptolyngbyaceae cyanobacterium LF-bin-113]
MMTSKQKRAKTAQLLREFGPQCFWCGCDLPPGTQTLDHLKPKSRGGSNSLENLRLACFSCNNFRGDSLFPPRKPFKR